MKKRVLAFLLATVFVLTLVMSVSAEGVQCDLSGTKNCTLTVKGTTAHCHSSLTDSSGTIKSVKVEQSLKVCFPVVLEHRGRTLDKNGKLGRSAIRQLQGRIERYISCEICIHRYYQGWQVRNDYYVQQ